MKMIVDPKNYIPLKKAFEKNKWEWKESEELFKCISVSNKGNMWLYNYNDNVFVERNHPVLVKCRGLIVDSEGRILNFPFERFFNDWEKEKAEIDWKSAEIQEKVDGCFHSLTKINTDIGKITIGEIVNKQLPVKVATYNTKLGIVEYKKIIKYHKEKRKSYFLCIGIERIGHSRGTSIVCTPNHKFYTKNGWIKTSSLKKGMEVYHICDKIDEDIKQVILGTLLGDGSISSYRTSKTRKFTICHCKSQEGYFDFKAKILGNLFTKGREQRGGYTNSEKTIRGHSLSNHAVSDLIINFCEIDNKKRVTEKWANALNPLGLAIWYMDDGSCVFSDKQRPRLRIATNGFSFDEAKILINSLKRFGLSAKVFDYKGATICFDANSTEKFFNLIYPYVPKCMKYKISKKYKNYPCVLENPNLKNYQSLLKLKIISISKKLPKRYTIERMNHQYDLTLEKNHNYFACDILVHNSMCSCFWNGSDWEITTRGSFYPNVKYDSDFSKLFKKHFKKFNLFDKNFSYIFEIVTKENRIVTYYDHEAVYLVGIRDLTTLKEVSQKVLDETVKILKVKRPKKYSAENVEQCKKLFENMKEDEEGLVVVDNNFNRIKLKQESYLKLARITMLNEQDIFEYVLGYSQIDVEFINRLPEVKEKIDKIRKKWNKIMETAKEVFEIIKDKPTRKEFASEAMKYPFNPILFAMLDKREIAKERMRWDRMKNMVGD